MVQIVKLSKYKTNKYFQYVVIILLTTVFIASKLNAEDKIDILSQSNAREITFESDIRYLVDPRGDLLLENVLTNPLFSTENQAPSFGYSNSYHWFGLSVINRSDAPVQRVLVVNNLVITNIRVFAIHSQAEIREISQRLPRNKASFIIDVPAHEELKFVLRIQFGHQLMTTFSLAPTDQWQNVDRRELVLPIICYGVYIGLMLYNLFLFISMRYKSYLFYSIFIVTIASTIFVLNGFLYMIWAIDPYPGLLTALADFTVFTAAIFTSNFLNLSEKEPKLNRLLNCSIVLAGVLGTLLLFQVWPAQLTYATDLNMGIAASIVIYTALKEAINGFRPATFYLISWACTITSTIIWFLYSYKILPHWPQLQYSVNMGLALEMVLISFALGDLVNILRRQLLNQLREANQILEQKVAERTAEVQEKSAKMRFILSRIQQGIFIVDKNYTIDAEYSGFLETLLNEKNIAGRRLDDVLLNKTDLNSEEKSKIYSAIDFSFGESDYIWEANSAGLINELQMIDGQRKKTIEVDWQAGFNSDELLDTVLVTMRDVTEIRTLRQAAEQQQFEIAIIAEIVQISPQRFFHVTQNIMLHIENIRNKIQKDRSYHFDTLVVLGREMHTLKGEARSYGLKNISSLAHELESSYIKSRDNREWHPEQLLIELQKLEDLCAKYLNISEAKLGRSLKHEKTNVSREAIENILMKYQMVLGKKSNVDLGAVLHELNEIVNPRQGMTLQECLAPVLANLPELAQSLNKATPNVQFHGRAFLFDPASQNVFERSFVHILRNALDHGIETREERRSLGKMPSGNISIDVNEMGSNMLILCRDDGRGLAISRVYKAALAKKIISKSESLTWDRIMDLIFNPGFSTAEIVTEVSGRGIGMEAVKAFIKEIGGDLKLIPLIDLPSDLRGVSYVPFTLKIVLPKSRVLGIDNSPLLEKRAS